MRFAIILAAAAFLVAGQAQAQCRTAIAEAVLSSFGPVIAANGHDETVHRVSGLRMLGRSVPHVVVERQYGGAISALRYRLGQEVRGSGERIAADLERQFQALYTASCANLTCSAYPDHGYDLGSLQSVELQDIELYVDDAWTGPAVSALIVQDEGAVYLSCYYKAVD